MRHLNTIEELDEALRVADRQAAISDQAMREHLASFSFGIPSPEADPFSRAYQEGVIAQYERVSGRSMALENEYTSFDFDAALIRPFPFVAGSQSVISDYYIQLAYLLKALDLTEGVVADLGAGWGVTTEMLARCGLEPWAVDMNPDFCRLIEERCRRQGLAVNVITGDFFSVEHAPPLDAAVFFESFHHCLNHNDLLDVLYRKLRPGGVLAFAGEPIEVDRASPWGLRGDGMAAWSIRKFGWLELGLDEDYFLEALLRAGFAPTRIAIPNMPSAYRAVRCGRLFPSDVVWPRWREAGWAGPESDPTFRHRFTRERLVIPRRAGTDRITLQNFRPNPLSIRVCGEEAVFAAGEQRILDCTHDGEIEIQSDVWSPREEYGNDDPRTLGIAVKSVDVVGEADDGL